MVVIQHELTLTIILTLVFLGISILSCAGVCLHYLIKRSGLSETADRLLFCLAFSDLVGAVAWWLDIMVPHVLCPYSGVANMVGYQAAQLWTCIIGAYLIITCSAKQPPHEIVFYIIAFGAPVLVQVVVLSLRMYENNPAPHGCWVSYGNLQTWVVTVPQLLSGFLNIVFLATIVYKMRISAKRWGLQSRDRGLFFVMICFIITTVSGVLESIPSDTDLIYKVAVCFGGLQGFFNAIAMKQKAVLLFLGQMKTRMQPSLFKRRSFMPSINSPPSLSPSTWLLSKSSDDSIPTHPATHDSYTDYYRRTIYNALPPEPASMESFASSSAPVSPPPPTSPPAPFILPPPFAITIPSSVPARGTVSQFNQHYPSSLPSRGTISSVSPVSPALKFL